MPLNDSNFLIWFAAGESQFDTELPRPFVREPEVISPVVWLVPGETYTFYLNSADNYSHGEPLGLYHENGTTYNLDGDNLATSVSFPGGAHRYGSFTVPSNIAEGLCKLGIDTYRTQWLYAAPAIKANKFSRIVRFRNDRRLQNVRYGYLDNDFYQVFRIRMAVRGEESAHEKTTYKEATTGKVRNYYSEPGMVVTLLTPEYDRWGHRAMAALIEHDYIEIGGKRYNYESAYKSNMNEGDALSQGEFSLRDDGYSTLNRA